MTSTTPVGLRADARDNRDRIITASAEAFAVIGTGISMTEVAKRAGVGVATLFRHFATKEKLVDAVFAASVTWWLERLNEALAERDSWSALSRMITDVAAEQARHPACADMIVTSFLHGDGFAAERATVEDGFTDLIRRSQADGRAAADLEWIDIALLLEANAAVIMGAADDASAASHRLTTRLLRAFALAAPAGYST
ncbi:TetR family transcriptional regulator [Homoserinimonas aerilata]|uniref:TetR family transcriptional regulator n=1 Tax=Homoserinimonas aerilata TaxID=1162970 RepID=A0A542Y1J0_9MICO|nr:TetR/AcrR family transcriptional regulator [Homoserinimonas aerilata]TQL41951.1 TetR family transcriptional regulator [Homoserinimonas aerilata]